MDVNEFCPECAAPAERLFMPQRVYLSGTKVQNAEYNVGLGAVVKNAYERSELAKRKGLVEVGNDFKSGDSMQKNFDGERAVKREKAWEDA